MEERNEVMGWIVLMILSAASVLGLIKLLVGALQQLLLYEAIRWAWLI